MRGKSMGYYFIHKDGEGYLKISAGKLTAGEKGETWEFFSEVADFPTGMTEAAAEAAATKFFSTFMNTKAQLFWNGKIKANSDDYGHPVLHD